jgi:hypothetical protein
MLANTSAEIVCFDYAGIALLPTETSAQQLLMKSQPSKLRSDQNRSH